MKRRHDDSLKLVDLAVGDLCYRYKEAVPLRSEALPAKRLFRHWKGPYFVTNLQGENSTVLDDKLNVSKTVHRNLPRRYVYLARRPAVAGRAPRCIPRRGVKSLAQYRSCCCLAHGLVDSVASALAK